MLYLDHAASTPLTSKALEVLQNSFAEDMANPAASHRLGKDLFKKIENCRTSFLEAVNGQNHYRFIFTGSATESNNTVIKQFNLDSNQAIFSNADHPSVTEPLKNHQQIQLPLNSDGTISICKMLELVNENTTLMVISHVNNHSGIINPVIEIAKAAKNKNPKIHIHVDAAQGFAKIPLSLKDNVIDSVTISAHKMGGPKGMAGLYLKNGLTITPLLVGGGHENGLRSSTPASPLIFSWEAALKEKVLSNSTDFEIVKRLNIKIRMELSRLLPEIRFPFSVDNCSPYIITFIIPKVSSDIILRHLENKNIFISSSSACSSRQKGISPVFSALGIPAQNHKNVLRVSFSPLVNESNCDLFIETLNKTYNDLKLLL